MSPTTKQKNLVRAALEVAVYSAAFVVAGIYLPWWGVCVPAFVIALLVASPGEYTVRKLALAAGITWFVAIALNDVPTAFRLSSRVAQVMSMRVFPVAYLMTTVLAVALSTLAALMGAYLRALFVDRERAGTKRPASLTRPGDEAGVSGK